MKRLSLLLVLVLLGVLVAAPAAQAARPATPFTGTWIGSDPAPPDGDGSTVHLVIGSGNNPSLVFTDEFGSVCVNAGATVTFFRSSLTGSVDGSTLTARFKNAKCGNVVIDFLIGLRAVYEFDDNGTDDPSDDTLWDGSVLWHRND